MGVRIPDDLRMVGIDDVSYAGLLPVPLTTLRQPCREIGAAAVAALRERVARPDLPPRDILLHGTLVIRESCGTESVRTARASALVQSTPKLKLGPTQACSCSS